MRKLGLALVLGVICAAALGAGRARGIVRRALRHPGRRLDPLRHRLGRRERVDAAEVDGRRHRALHAALGRGRGGAARKRPQPRAIPKYRWSAYDEIFGALHAAKIPVVVTIYGAPRWTNGGRAPNWAPSSGSTIAGFAYAAQLRYPWIHDWTIWNEPNKPIFLRPTSPVVYTARLLNPAYAALHSASRSAKVAGGVTAPRAGSGGVSPSRGSAAMGAAHARLDAYAHHPYPASPQRDAVHRRLRALLDDHDGDARQAPAEVQPRVRQQADLADGVRVPGRTRPTGDGVSPALQARYVGDAARRVYEAAGVDMLIHFLYRDEPNLAAWQSGFLTVQGLRAASHSVPSSCRCRRRRGEVCGRCSGVRCGRRPAAPVQARAVPRGPLALGRLDPLHELARVLPDRRARRQGLEAAHLRESRAGLLADPRGQVATNGRRGGCGSRPGARGGSQQAGLVAGRTAGCRR